MAMVGANESAPQWRGERDGYLAACVTLSHFCASLTNAAVHMLRLTHQPIHPPTDRHSHMPHTELYGSRNPRVLPRIRLPNAYSPIGSQRILVAKLSHLRRQCQARQRDLRWSCGTRARIRIQNRNRNWMLHSSRGAGVECGSCRCSSQRAHSHTGKKTFKGYWEISDLLYFRELH